MAVIGRLDLAIGRPTRHHARIGDQDIDRRGAIEVFEPPAYLRPGPDVDRRHMRFSAVSSALRSHPVETLAVAAQQPEARPLAGVAQRQRLADYAGCAGDDDRGWHEQSNSMFTKPIPGAGLSGIWWSPPLRPRIRPYRSVSGVVHHSKIGSRCPLWVVCGRRLIGKSFFDVDAALVGCGHVSGLLMRHGWPLALMLCADQVPILFTHSKMR